jgi:hypothetical protein
MIGKISPSKSSAGFNNSKAFRVNNKNPKPIKVELSEEEVDAFIEEALAWGRSQPTKPRKSR